MISVQDGQNRILTQITRSTSPEFLPLGKTLGRVVAEDVRAPFDVPPTDNSAVDGYAVGSADIPATGTRDLRVVADLPAGSVFDGALAAGETVRIMTGAPMARGADTVYPQEVVTKLDGGRVRVGPIAKGTNVRMRGEDIHAGTIVIERGTVLRPQEIGLIASLGQVQVPVHRRPRIVLLSTGDEVVEPGQLRQPGRPLAVGRIGSAHFFGLPGNPVASMLTFMLFVRPAIHKLAGRRRLFPEVYEACATETMRKKKGRREFKRGVVRFRDGRWEVRTTGPQGSGILSSMVAGNCLIVLEEERGDVAAGETVLVEPF